MVSSCHNEEKDNLWRIRKETSTNKVFNMAHTFLPLTLSPFFLLTLSVWALLSSSVREGTTPSSLFTSLFPCPLFRMCEVHLGTSCQKSGKQEKKREGKREGKSEEGKKPNLPWLLTPHQLWFQYRILFFALKYQTSIRACNIYFILTDTLFYSLLDTIKRVVKKIPKCWRGLLVSLLSRFAHSYQFFFSGVSQGRLPLTLPDSPLFFSLFTHCKTVPKKWFNDHAIK